MLWLGGGFPLIPSVLTAGFLIVGGFFPYEISVKIAGESGFGPTIMMVSLSLILLFAVLRPFGGFSVGELPLLVIVGTVAFTAALVVPVTVQWDYKTALYIGTAPRSLFKAQAIAVMVGIPVCAIFASLISKGISLGSFEINAPQPFAFSTLLVALNGGKVYYSLLFLGLVIGIVVEILSKKGTIFGIGMFFPLGLPLMLLIGGISRDMWERSMEKRYGTNSEKKTLKLLDSYMIMTGFFVGEAMLGILITIRYLI